MKQALINSKISLYLLLLTGITCLAYYGYFSWQTLQGISPYFGDGLLYLSDARGFALDGRWASTYLIDNKQSFLGDFGAHGFSYLLLYGSWLTLFPQEATFSSILLHLLSLAIACVCLFRYLPFSYRLKLLSIVLFLSNPLVGYYCFSFMVESPNALFAVITSILLYRIYQTPSQKTLMLFVMVIVLLTCIRATWVLWLIGLLPLLKDRKYYFFGFIAFLGTVMIGFTLFKITHAPYEGGFIPQLVVQLKTKGVINSVRFFIDHFFQNSYMYFRYFYTPYYVLMKYAIVLGSGVFIWWGMTSKNKFVLATGLIIGLNWLTVIVWYDAFDWRDIRALTGVFLLGTIVLITQFRQQFAYLLLVIQLMLFPFLWQDSQALMDEKQMSYQQWQSSAELKTACRELQEQLGAETNPISISIDLMTYGSFLALELPLQSTSAQALQYSIFFGAPEYEDNLRFFLLPPTMKVDRGKVLMNNRFFKLVDVREERS